MNDRLEFDSVEIAFGGRIILSSIYMRCEKGQITGLLGRNGSGKTTLMRIVFGAMPHPQKSVRINGSSLGLDYLSRNVIAYLPQSDLIPGYLTLRRALSLFAVPSEYILEDFPEFEAMMDIRPSEMSVGYLRIFEVLMVLRSRAEFCLLDEPFTGLTPMYVDRMKQILKRVKEVKGLIITDHMHRHVVDVPTGCTFWSTGKHIMYRMLISWCRSVICITFEPYDVVRTDSWKTQTITTHNLIPLFSRVGVLRCG